VALEAPDLIERLTLIGVHPGLASEVERAERARLDAERAARLRRHGLEEFVLEWEVLPLFATQTAAQRAAQRASRLGHEVEGLCASLRYMGLGAMPDYGARCGSLAMPTSLVVGARDERFAELAGGLCARWPELRLELIPDVGHNAVIEAPAAVARVISPA
jgi:2-succinyl-6-hydroxy-2,4-cyclohexadiene-1-carboxylate synthase